MRGILFCEFPTQFIRTLYRPFPLHGWDGPAMIIMTKKESDRSLSDTPGQACPTVTRVTLQCVRQNSPSRDQAALTNQAQDILRRIIGLSQRSRSGLDQDLGSCHISGFSGKVGIANGRFGRHQVLIGNLE